jgi:superfamily II DNA or RNA helicase
VVEDTRPDGQPLDVLFLGDLRDAQAEAVDAVLAHDDGILLAPPGSGKTVMACAVIAARGVNTLVLVESRHLAAQWRDRVQTFLGVKTGQLGAGRKKLRGGVDIVLLQSLARREDLADLTHAYGQVIVDECHHLGAASYARAVRQIAAPYWLGMTATLERKDRLEELVRWQLGPVRHEFAQPHRGEPTLFSPPTTAERRAFVHVTPFRLAHDIDPHEPGGMAEIYRHMAADEGRNQLIVEGVADAMGRGRKCVVLTRWVNHVHLLSEMLRVRGFDPLVLRGGISKTDLEDSVARLTASTAADSVLIVGTMPFMGEGFDAVILDTAFLVVPLAQAGSLIQNAGRVLRELPGKTRIEVHDYHDEHVPVLASAWAKRRRGYQRLGFTVTGPGRE